MVVEQGIERRKGRERSWPEMQPEIKSKKKKKKKIRGADNRPNCKTPLSCDTMVNAKTELSSHDAGNSFYAETIFVGAKKIEEESPVVSAAAIFKKEDEDKCSCCRKIIDLLQHLLFLVDDSEAKHGEARSLVCHGPDIRVWDRIERCKFRYHVVPEGDEGSTVPHLRCKSRTSQQKFGKDRGRCVCDKRIKTHLVAVVGCGENGDAAAIVHHLVSIGLDLVGADQEL